MTNGLGSYLERLLYLSTSVLAASFEKWELLLKKSCPLKLLVDPVDEQNHLTSIVVMVVGVFWWKILGKSGDVLSITTLTSTPSAAVREDIKTNAALSLTAVLCFCFDRFLVPRDMSVGQFIYILSSRLRVPPGKALFVFVKNTLPQTASLMDSVYESYKDEDGFLYMCYSSEKTFGSQIM